MAESPEKLGAITHMAAARKAAPARPMVQWRKTSFSMATILSYLLGGWMIGWASAPFNPAWQRQYPRRSAWMALAGPAANFSLMLLAGIAIRIGLAAGYFQPPSFIHGYAGFVVPANSAEPTFFTSALSILFVLNLLLGTFNLLPVPPLDGHAGIMVLMPEALAQHYMAWVEHARGFAMLGIIIAWTLYGRMFLPILEFAIRTLYAGVRGG